jgi:hypothetical protein
MKHFFLFVSIPLAFCSVQKTTAFAVSQKEVARHRCDLRSFPLSSSTNSPRHRLSLLLRSKEEANLESRNDIPEDFDFVVSTPVAERTSTSDIYSSLQERVNSLENGVGKRYVVRTQQGFLNVHSSPEDPFNTGNVVSRLRDGDIVTSTGMRVGAWIPHDGGGWSISVYNGFTWLEAVKE